MGSEYSDFMFSKMLPFETLDLGSGFVLNAFTDWGNTELRGDMAR
jgi:hypothetical protein